MPKELEELARRIRKKSLRRKVLKFLKELDTSPGLPLEESPGGKTRHHAYPGGLVQHTYAMTKLALSLCDIAEEVYGWKVDRDTVIAACILHDLMKAATYSALEEGYDYSPLGERLDHVSLIIAELRKEKFPMDVVHAVAAHHGDKGPVTPKTLEALIVHLADFMDAKLNGMVLQAAKFLARKCANVELSLVDTKLAYDIVTAKKKKGCEGVKKVLEKAGKL